MICGINSPRYTIFILAFQVSRTEKSKRKEPWQIAKAQSIKTKTGKGDDAYIIKCDC